MIITRLDSKENGDLSVCLGRVRVKELTWWRKMVNNYPAECLNGAKQENRLEHIRHIRKVNYVDMHWRVKMEGYLLLYHDVEVRLLQDFWDCGCILHPFTGWNRVWMWDNGHLGENIPGGHRGTQNSANWQWGTVWAVCLAMVTEWSLKITPKPNRYTCPQIQILQTSWDSCPKMLLGQVIVVLVCFPAPGSGICWLWELAGVCPHVATCVSPSAAASAACHCLCHGGPSCCWGRS